MSPLGTIGTEDFQRKTILSLVKALGSNWSLPQGSCFITMDLKGSIVHTSLISSYSSPNPTSGCSGAFLKDRDASFQVKEDPQKVSVAATRSP